MRRLAKAAAGWAALTGSAHAVDFEYSGLLQTDIRYRIDTVKTGSWYNLQQLDPSFNRNQNLLKTRLSAKQGRSRFVLDADLVYMGFSDPIDDVADLARREVVDPHRIELHSMYVEAWDVGLRGLDIRVGQQRVMWGVGDQFNPTNNLNADDIEDPLLFGDQLGNIMARVDYTPVGDWSLTAVVVPIFKPALLPDTGSLALAMVDRVPVQQDELRRKLLAEAFLVENLLGWPTVVGGVNPVMPENTLQNMQWSARVGGTVLNQDIALSWYDGRFDFPVPVANHTVAAPGQECNPADPEDCINGRLVTTPSVGFPRMQVLGFNATGEVDALGWMSKKIAPIGYRAEIAYIRPEATPMAITNDELALGIYTQPAGEYDYGLGKGVKPTSIQASPFMKWTLGLDYSFGKHVYFNGQWVHGMPDEFGAGDWLFEGTNTLRQARLLTDADGVAACNLLDRQGENCIEETLRPRIGDYGVMGIDVTFGQNLLRTFAIVDFTPILVETWDAEAEARTTKTYAWHTDKARSYVLYPELSHKFGNGFELAGGAVLLFGESWSKFGDPAGGGSQVFTRARYAF